jgi:hypothetical protein
MKCRKCSAEYTVSEQEKQELIQRHGSFRPPKSCPDCREKGARFREMIDDIVFLHSWAFGILNNHEKWEALQHIAQRVVINAQKAGLLEKRRLFIPVGSGEIRDEINEYRKSLGLEDMRLFEDPRFGRQNRPMIRDD